MRGRTRVAVLDDYQGVALSLADWSFLDDKAEVTVFRDHLFDEDKVVNRLLPFEIVCLMRERTPLPRSVLERLPNLKLIVTTAMRNASIDMAAAADRGILVCGTRSPANGTPELTWALILSLVRHLPEEIDSVRRGGWQLSLGGDLEGKTLGIVGLGKIGVRVARIAHAFGMKVLAWSQNLQPDVAESHGCQAVSKEELFRDSDIVTLHLVLSERTRGVVGEAELGWMKPGAYLVNTSRAALIDGEALVAALKDAKIRGVALDVYDTEPLPADHPFRHNDRIIATPHIGFVTEEGYRIFYRDVVEDLRAWFDGNPVRVLAGDVRRR